MIRPYTPLSSVNQEGWFEFLIKVYDKTEDYPNGGGMGRYVESKNVGDELVIDGPVGKAIYEGNGRMNL